MPVRRLDANPLITPADVPPTRDDLTVLCTLNPGAVRFGEEVLLLVRVGEAARDEPGSVGVVVYNHHAGRVEVRRYHREDPDLVSRDGRGFDYRGKMLLTSMSHLRIARSRDMVHWTVDPAPAIFPTTEWEAYGCEDARITPLEGRYYITYTAVSGLGVNPMLAVTDDFVHFEKLGILFPSHNKDVVVFPRKIEGCYVCRHRPYKTQFNDSCIWTAFSPDLRHWGGHSVLHRPAPGTREGERVGAGGTPVETDAGWLEIYHAADHTGRYTLSAMLTELDRPDRLIGTSTEPVLVPEAPYEMAGVFAHCVFSNGLVIDDDGTLTIFYGAADTICAAAVSTVDEMVAAALS